MSASLPLNPMRLAWAAGFIDGEGSIQIAKGRTNGTSTYYSLNLSVAQIDAESLGVLRRMFGGSVQRRVRGAPNQTPIGKWEVASRKALAALELLEPYMVVKRREALLAIRYQRYKSGRGQLRHTPGRERARNEWYKAALQRCRTERKAEAWAAVA